MLIQMDGDCNPGRAGPVLLAGSPVRSQFLTFMVSESTAFLPVTPSRPARIPR